METGERLGAIPAGSKKLHGVMLKNDTCLVVAWQDCSFDLYDISRREVARQVEAPISNPVIIQSCQLTVNGDLVALTTTKVTNPLQQRSYSIWFWDTEDERSMQVRCFFVTLLCHLMLCSCSPGSF